MKQSQEKLARRTVLGGAATAGVALGAAALVGARPSPAPVVETPPAAALPKRTISCLPFPAPDGGLV